MREHELLSQTRVQDKELQLYEASFEDLSTPIDMAGVIYECSACLPLAISAIIATYFSTLPDGSWWVKLGKPGGYDVGCSLLWDARLQRLVRSRPFSHADYPAFADSVEVVLIDLSLGASYATKQAPISKDWVSPDVRRVWANSRTLWVASLKAYDWQLGRHTLAADAKSGFIAYSVVPHAIVLTSAGTHVLFAEPTALVWQFETPESTTDIARCENDGFSFPTVPHARAPAAIRFGDTKMALAFSDDALSVFCFWMTDYAHPLSRNPRWRNAWGRTRA